MPPRRTRASRAKRVTNYPSLANAPGIDLGLTMTERGYVSVDDVHVEIGSTGLRQFGGLVYEEFLPQLTMWQGIRVYKEMSTNDATISAMLYGIEMLLRQVPWRVEPAGDTEQDKEAVEFLETCFEDMEETWQVILSQILSMLVYGWALLETTYKTRGGTSEDKTKDSLYDDGRIGWRKWEIRAQETLRRWYYDQNTLELKGMIQVAPPRYIQVTIPIEKALHFRLRAIKANPEGQSLLRHCYREWYFKKNIEEIEAIGIERDLCGIPIAWVPPEIISGSSPEASEENQRAYQSYKDMITKIHRNEDDGIVMPLTYDDNNNKRYDISLLSTGGRRQFDINGTIQRKDQRIAMTMLTDVLLLGSSDVGTYALATSKTGMLMASIGAILDAIEDEINQHAIPRLFKLNSFEDLSGFPKYRHGDVQKITPEEISNFILNLFKAGMQIFPNSELEEYLLDTVSLPGPGIKTPAMVEPQAQDEESAHEEAEEQGEEQQRAQRAPAYEVPATRQNPEAAATPSSRPKATIKPKPKPKPKKKKDDAGSPPNFSAASPWRDGMRGV